MGGLTGGNSLLRNMSTTLASTSDAGRAARIRAGMPADLPTAGGASAAPASTPVQTISSKPAEPPDPLDRSKQLGAVAGGRGASTILSAPGAVYRGSRLG